MERPPNEEKEIRTRKSPQTTEIYINIERTLFEPSGDEFTVKVVEKSEDVKTLLEALNACAKRIR